MHFGSIDNPATKPAQVYRVLRSRLGEWVDALDLTVESGMTTAISTRISEIRTQLARDRARWEAVQRKQIGRKQYYRLVRVERKGQLDLFDAI